MGDNSHKIKDIYDINDISWWPLATGYWVIIFLIFLSIIVATIYLIKRRKYQNSWRFLAYNEFESLFSKGQITAYETHEFIKKIAIKKFGRKNVASLNGAKWLEFLAKHDSKFAWQEKGSLLINNSFSPTPYILSKDEVKRFEEAIKNLLRK